MLSRQKRSAGQEVHVLDIGTGTGLLSMMAVRLGADSVVACEEFRPMAECAERVMKENGYWDRIKLGWSHIGLSPPQSHSMIILQ